METVINQMMNENKSKTKNEMLRKRYIITQKIKKYKALLNVDGSRMRQGLHYEKVYAPVASYSSIRLLFIMTLIHRWNTKQIDYVQAFPQAPVEKYLFLKVTAGFEVQGGTRDEYALKLHKKVYVQKQARRVWYKYLTNKLVNEMGFTRSKID